MEVLQYDVIYFPVHTEFQRDQETTISSYVFHMINKIVSILRYFLINLTITSNVSCFIYSTCGSIISQCQWDNVTLLVNYFNPNNPTYLIHFLGLLDSRSLFCDGLTTTIVTGHLVTSQENFKGTLVVHPRLYTMTSYNNLYYTMCITWLQTI